MSTKQMKSDRNDLNTAIVVGGLVIAWLLYDGIRALVQLFATAGSVTVTTRIPAQELTAAIGAGTTGTVDTATLTVENVNVISIVCLVLAIVLRTLCLVGAAAVGVILCRRLMRGAVFDRMNSRLTFAMSIALLVAGLAGCWFENMGLNGVFAALDGEFDDQWLLFADEIPLLIAALAVGVLVIVFRRGSALQRDAEGLV